MRYIHAMDYYSALKRSGVLTKAATWMNPKGTALSEMSQSHKDKHYLNPLWEVPRAVEFLGTSRTGWRGREEGV